MTTKRVCGLFCLLSITVLVGCQRSTLHTYVTRNRALPSPKARDLMVWQTEDPGIASIDVFLTPGFCVGASRDQALAARVGIDPTLEKLPKNSQSLPQCVFNKHTPSESFEYFVVIQLKAIGKMLAPAPFSQGPNNGHVGSCGNGCSTGPLVKTVETGSIQTKDGIYKAVRCGEKPMIEAHVGDEIDWDFGNAENVTLTSDVCNLQANYTCKITGPASETPTHLTISMGCPAPVEGSILVKP